MRHVFFCIDGHTAGNPVRLVTGGGPFLQAGTMPERRLEFIEHYDWIRTGLCCEPRGHAMMSGGFLFPPSRDDTHFGILFIETSGCLPMCGHGTIGMVTFALENGLVQAPQDGKLRIEVPAGIIEASFDMPDRRVRSVRLRNVPSYVAAEGIAVEVPELGKLAVDVAYGGNFYAIVEPQGRYTGLDHLGAGKLVELGRAVRERVRAQVEPVHPLYDSIRGVSHVLWADEPASEGAAARNAVFYGDSALDRSPCGTGTSARMAHLYAKGALEVRQPFVHESYIHSFFRGRVEEEVMLGDYRAIVPSIEGSAFATGHNTIWIDSEDPFPAGFTVT